MIPKETEFKDILRKLGRSENTIKAYINDLNILFNSDSDITEEAIQTTIFSMVDNNKKPATIRRFVSSIKTYCSIFRIDINFSKISKPKIVVRESSYIVDKTFANGIGMILADTRIDQYDIDFRCAIFNFLYKTGIRVNELLSLNQRHYNKEHGFIQIVGKGNKQRKVPICKSLTYVFDLNWIFARLNKVHYNTVLFWTKKYFGKEYSPHSFRHGFTTKLVKNGTSERAVQTVLGHESFVTTLRYFHMNYEEINNEVISAMEEDND